MCNCPMCKRARVQVLVAEVQDRQASTPLVTADVTTVSASVQTPTAPETAPETTE